MGKLTEYFDYLQTGKSGESFYGWICRDDQPNLNELKRLAKNPDYVVKRPERNKQRTNTDEVMI